MNVEDVRSSQMPIKARDTVIGGVYESSDRNSFYMRTNGATLASYVLMINLRTGVAQAFRDVEFYFCPNCTLTIK